VKRLSIAFLALAAAFALTPMAQASTFDFSYTAPGGVYGSGTLIGTTYGPGYVVITSATGTFDDGVNSGSISLIANPIAPGAYTSPSGYNAYDDLLYLGQSDGNVLDFDGLLFSFDGMELVLWEQGAPGMDGWAENNGNSGYGELTVTPEPGSLLLMGTGLLGLAVGLLRKAKLSRRVSHA
jgi:PEP-CTERM motif